MRRTGPGRAARGHRCSLWLSAVLWCACVQTPAPASEAPASANCTSKASTFGTSASETTTATSNDDTAIAIADALGRRVALRQPATRIAALSPGFTETLFAVGCGDQVVLRDKWSNFPAGAQSLPAVDGAVISVTSVASFRPDLVLLYFKDDRNTHAFAQLGIPVAVFDPKSYAAVAEMIASIAVLCGRADAGRQLAAHMRQVAERVTARVATQPQSAPSVYVEVDASDIARPWTIGRDALVTELLEMAGGRNALAHIRAPYAQVSAEEVLRADPAFVLLLSPGSRDRSERIRELSQRPGYADLRAIAQGRLIAEVDPDLVVRTGPRLAEGLQALHDALFPAPLETDRPGDTPLSEGP